MNNRDKFFIGGRWVAPSTKETIEVHNAGTGAVMGSVPAGAEVKVEEVEGNPGYYSAKFHLRPHYQLEGVNVTMSLVARLPSEKK